MLLLPGCRISIGAHVVFVNTYHKSWLLLEKVFVFVVQSVDFKGDGLCFVLFPKGWWVAVCLCGSMYCRSFSCVVSLFAAGSILPCSTQTKSLTSALDSS